MSSTLFKTLLAGAVAAGALLLPASAAQASVSHDPCDGPGFGFQDDGFGFQNDGFGFQDDDYGMFGDNGFRDDYQDNRPTVIVITVKDKKHHKKHHAGATMPMPSDTATTTGSDAGYTSKR